MSLYKRGGIWWSRIVRNGERIDRSTKQKPKVGAQSVEARWLTAINDTGELSTVKPVQLEVDQEGAEDQIAAGRTPA